MKALFKDGQTVLFQGDSITDCGRLREDLYSLGNGYPTKVAEIYSVLFPNEKVTFINKGISGDTTTSMLARYDNDFKGITPDFISILIGINDVWRRYDRATPTSFEKFMENYETYLKKLKADFPNAKIMMMEPFLLDTDVNKANFHEDLDPKITGVRKLAGIYADYYLPLDGILNKIAKTTSTSADISADSVHPTPNGHALVAYEYLKELEII